MTMHYDLPGKFVLFDINQSILNRFVHERVHTGDEKVDGAQQRVSVFGQTLLGFSVVTELLLKNRVKTILSEFCLFGTIFLSGFIII